jgi:squalene-hopene/tetraprenyl-beta-curcumene cyclase
MSLLVLCGGCCSGDAPSDESRLVLSADEARAQLIDQSIAAALHYLAGRQSPDGAWRSGVYGFFKDGTTLTPHVLWALASTGAGDDAGTAEVMRWAAGFLAGESDDDVSLIYPVYTAAQMSLSSAWLPRPRETAARWTALLRKHQLAEPLCWTPDDAEFGGWGYAQSAPAKPQAGAFRGPWDWSNLTATTWALEALRAAGSGADDPACRRALAFVGRCQNFGGDSTAAVAADGGFFFSPTIAMRNKAGLDSVANRFNSYGSMTCDGVRALLACGVPSTDPRVLAARHWIESNFDVAHNPGRFASANEDLRDSIYYYYAFSLSRTLRALGSPRQFDTAHGRVDWADALAMQLITLQRPDGSWANRFTDGKEDDPLVATPLALSALVNCRDAISHSAGAAVISGPCDTRPTRSRSLP